MTLYSGSTMSSPGSGLLSVAAVGAPYTSNYVIPKVLSPTVVGTTDYEIGICDSCCSGGSHVVTLTIGTSVTAVLSVTVGALPSNGPSLKETPSVEMSAPESRLSHESVALASVAPVGTRLAVHSVCPAYEAPPGFKGNLLKVVYELLWSTCALAEASAASRSVAGTAFNSAAVDSSVSGVVGAS